MSTEHCPTPVTQRDCDHRHRGVTRWLSMTVVLAVAVLGSAGTSFVIARGASQDVAVHKAVQAEVNKHILGSLNRIETDVRILRNGSGHE